MKARCNNTTESRNPIQKPQRLCSSIWTWIMILDDRLWELEDAPPLLPHLLSLHPLERETPTHITTTDLLPN